MEEEAVHRFVRACIGPARSPEPILKCRTDGDRVTDVLRREKEKTEQNDEISRAIAAATAPLEMKLYEQERELRRKDAGINMLVLCKDELIAEKRTLEAEFAPATTRRKIMVRNLMIVVFAALAGWTYYQLKQLERSYVTEIYGSAAALEGKTTLEITPDMEKFGVDKFVAVAQRLPYASAETIQKLFGSGANKVEQCYDRKNDPVVELRQADQWLDGNGNPVRRVVLVHVFPPSINAYVRAMRREGNRSDSTVLKSDFTSPQGYETSREQVSRLVADAAMLPTATRKELLGTVNMDAVAGYSEERVVLIIGPYGTSEKFVHLTDKAYRACQGWGWTSAVNASPDEAEKPENVSVK